MNFKTAHEIRKLLIKKEVSSLEVLEDSINKINKIEPELNAFISIDFENARKKAKEIDRKISRGEEVPLFAGIPIAIKDNICMKDTRTTCGSRMLEKFISPYDATVVKKLKESGAIIIGKTNMDEFAMGSSTESSAFKVTKNPYDLKRVPGGSSGGTAASVASGEVYCGLGSDTGGSIRQPASFCGVVGMKPTYGRVSRYGLVAFASSLDVIGPVTRDVEDCASLLSVVSGRDERDSTSSSVLNEDFTKYLSRNIKGMKIGIIKDSFNRNVTSDVEKVMNNSIQVLENIGTSIVEIDMPTLEYALEAYYIISSSEASSNLGRFDGVKFGYRSEDYDDIVEMYINSRSQGFGNEAKRRIMLGTYALSSGYYEEYYKRALRVKQIIIKEFKDAFKGIDLIVSPTSPTLPFKIGEKEKNPIDMYKSDIFTVPANIAGLPAISVPAGFSKGLPVGIQFIGNHFEEGKLISISDSFEKALSLDMTISRRKDSNGI